MSTMESLPQLDAPVELTERQRHLSSVKEVAAVAVASEYDPSQESDYFNDLSGADQIPCGD